MKNSGLIRVEDEKFRELYDIIRRLVGAKASDNEVKDVIRMMSQFDELTKEQKERINMLISKKNTELPTASTLGYFNDEDYSGAFF